MPYKSRLNVPGAVYHVLARCLDHVRLFPDDEGREFLMEGIAGDTRADALIDLVRKSNAGKEGGRSVSCWVIGDQEFVKKALSSSEARRLRISRYERDGKSLEHLAERLE